MIRVGRLTPCGIVEAVTQDYHLLSLYRFKVFLTTEGSSLQPLPPLHTLCSFCLNRRLLLAQS